MDEDMLQLIDSERFGKTRLILIAPSISAATIA